MCDELIYHDSGDLGHASCGDCDSWKYNPSIYYLVRIDTDPTHLSVCQVGITLFLF